MDGPFKIAPGAGASAEWGKARAAFRRMLAWILLFGVAMVAGALIYLSSVGSLTVNLVIATALGVFLMVLIGAGLFAAAFFSAKSGHDDSVSNAARPRTTPAAALPPGLEPYRRTDCFTQAAIPAGLLTDHATKAGTWALIHVADGLLRYRVTDPRRTPLDVILSSNGPAGVVEPTIRHHVEPLGAVRFHVEFWRARRLEAERTPSMPGAA